MYNIMVVTPLLYGRREGMLNNEITKISKMTTTRAEYIKFMLQKAIC